MITPGAVSTSFLVAYIPKGQTQFTSYIVRTVTAVTGGATATQAAGDSGGTYQTVATGEYIYTFSTKAPSGYDPTATHRIGIYGSRNLTQWDLGTNYADTTFDWVPAGNGAKPAPRDVVRTPDCNKCHDSLAAHGGSRKSVQLCIMCHQPQTVDPNTGNTLDMKVFIHKLHDGSGLPSVAGGEAVPDHRLSEFSQRLVHGGVSDRRPQLRADLPQPEERRGPDHRLHDQSQHGGLRLLPRRRQLRHRHRTTPAERR